MKILDKVQKIFNQYELKPIELPTEFKNVYVFLRAYPEFRKDFEPEKDDSYLIRRYRDHIPKGWYGFDIGSPIVPVWSTIIEQIVDVCLEADPNFEIHQIKIKFGGIRFYVHSETIEDVHEVESLIGTMLFDRALIY
jgi:hypothetical protein